MDYTTQITKRTSLITEGREIHEWDVTDRKGRRLGSTVTFSTHVFEPSDRTGQWFYHPAGTFFAWCPQATRGGEPFGAIQGWRFCKTEQERLHAVREYLRDAEDRAQKWDGR